MVSNQGRSPGDRRPGGRPAGRGAPGRPRPPVPAMLRRQAARNGTPAPVHAPGPPDPGRSRCRGGRRFRIEHAVGRPVAHPGGFGARRWCAPRRQPGRGLRFGSAGPGSRHSRPARPGRHAGRRRGGLRLYRRPARRRLTAPWTTARATAQPRATAPGRRLAETCALSSCVMVGRPRPVDGLSGLANGLRLL